MPNHKVSHLFLRRHDGFTLPFTPERPLFYLHIPKCGGSSINTLIRRAFAPDAVRQFTHHPDRITKNLDHLGVHLCYTGHVTCAFLEHLPADTGIMTVLRDPVDRALSSFYFAKSLGREQLLREGVRPDHVSYYEGTLEEYLTCDPGHARRNLGNVQTWMLSQPEMYHIAPDRTLSRADLDRAKRNLDQMTFVGLTERIAESVDLLCQMCEWPVPETVPYVNRTPDRPALRSINSDTRAILEEMTALDAELYRHGAERFADLLRDVPLPVRPGSPSQASICMTSPLAGHGWHEPEQGPLGTFRWTGKSASAEVRLAGCGPLRLSIDVIDTMAGVPLDQLEVTINGHPVPLLLMTSGAIHRYEGRIPMAEGDHRHRIELRLPRAIRPIDVIPGSSDTRELGIAVSRIEMSYQHAYASQAGRRRTSYRMAR